MVTNIFNHPTTRLMTTLLMVLLFSVIQTVCDSRLQLCPDAAASSWSSVFDEPAPSSQKDAAAPKKTDDWDTVIDPDAAVPSPAEKPEATAPVPETQPGQPPPAALPSSPLISLPIIPFSDGDQRLLGQKNARNLIEAIQEQAAKDARDLFHKLMPKLPELGPDWKLPWQLPTSGRIRAKFADESQYWEKYKKKLPPTGLSNELALRFLDQALASVAAQSREGGMKPRDFMITLYYLLQRENRPPDQILLSHFQQNATFAKEIHALKTNPGYTGKPTADEKMSEILKRRFAGMSDDQLKNYLAREMSLIHRRTKMTFLKSNNWEGLAKAKNDKELVQKGIWLASIKVTILLINPRYLNEFPELNPAACEDLANKVKQSFQVLIASGIAMKKHELDQDLKQTLKQIEEQLAAEEDPERRKELKEQERKAHEGHAKSLKKIEQEEADMRKVTFGVTPKSVAENAFVYRIASPPDLKTGLQVSKFTGWLRNGPAAVRIELESNIPPVEMDRTMARFLAELDAYTMIYSGD